MLAEPLNEVRSAKAWGEARAVPRAEAAVEMDERVGAVDADENARMGTREKSSAELVDEIDQMSGGRGGGSGNGNGNGGGGAAAAGAADEALQREEQEAARASERAVDKEMQRKMAELDGTTTDVASPGDSTSMRADADRVAALKRFKRNGPGPCDVDTAGDNGACGDACRIGAWRAVRELVHAGIIAPLARHPKFEVQQQRERKEVQAAAGGDRTLEQELLGHQPEIQTQRQDPTQTQRQDQDQDQSQSASGPSPSISASAAEGEVQAMRGDRATALDNINDAVHGIRARLSKRGGGSGAFVCLSEQIAHFLVNLAEVFNGVVIEISSLSGGAHGGHTSHYEGRAIDISSIAGAPLTLEHRALARAAANVCIHAGATGVYHAALDCGAHCAEHTRTLHCSFPVPGAENQDAAETCVGGG
jgi:hypothetical protein